MTQLISTAPALLPTVVEPAVLDVYEPEFRVAATANLVPAADTMGCGTSEGLGFSMRLGRIIPRGQRWRPARCATPVRDPGRMASRPRRLRVRDSGAIARHGNEVA